MPIEIPQVLTRLSPVKVVFGPGSLAQLGELARADGARRALLVTDPGIEAVGHAQRATASLRDAGLDVVLFDGARENPTTAEVEAGLRVARGDAAAADEAARHRSVDFVIGLGGGSAMDCAKGINLLLTNGGRMADYRGDPPMEQLARRRPLLPMILIPTTAGTGSEAQSFALISDAVTHEKMACGDRRPPERGGLRPCCAILDPELVRTCPRGVIAAAGIDAVAHAVETAGCRVRTDASRDLSRHAWRLLNDAVERVLAVGDRSQKAPGSGRDTVRPRPDSDDGSLPTTPDPWAEMLLGAHLAGAAIEASMLGAAHACANPLTARCGITHGLAVGAMLPHVVRFNSETESPTSEPREHPYSDLDENPERLAGRIEALLAACRIEPRLRRHGVPEAFLNQLADDAARQWTASFNPRPVGAAELLQIYKSAL